MKRCKGNQQVREQFRKDPVSAAKLDPGAGGGEGSRPREALGSEAPVGVEIRGAKKAKPGEPAGAPQARSSPG